MIEGAVEEAEAESVRCRVKGYQVEVWDGSDGGFRLVFQSLKEAGAVLKITYKTTRYCRDFGVFD